MASAALATISSAALLPPAAQSAQHHNQPNHRNRASFSAAPTPASLPSSSSSGPASNSAASSDNPPTSSYPTAMMRSSSQPQPQGNQQHQSQSQPSSQQSFTMSQSQPSSQQQALGANSFRAALNSSSFRDSAEPHGSQSFREEAPVPQIYSAIYSGTNVYEMEVNGIAVMRRRGDSWLNATQILKVAGVDKGKRTKILEKEIQTGEHEKIQGGYGKYQGTWIKFERAVEVCRQYHVEDLLRPLLTYDMGQDGGVAGSGNLNTPTKEQAMAAQRKRMYNPSQESRMEGGAGTFFKGISSTASNMVGIISKARFDSPAPRSRGGVKNGLTRAPSFNRQPSMQSVDDMPPSNSQQSFVSDLQGNDSAFSTQQNTQQSNGDAPEPPRKRQRIAMTPADSFGAYTPGGMETMANTFPGSPTEPNESFIYSQHGIDVHSSNNDGNNGPLPPLSYDASIEAESKRNMLMSLFMDSNASDPSKHDALRSMTPAELDMPIDAQSHTALHWAATLSRMPLLRTLVRAGASPFRVNAVGETALMRACLVTNSHEHNSMPDLLDVLGSTIEARDHKGRTVLHHIAVTSSVKGRSAASRYYLQSLLEWVVRQGVSSSQESQVNGAASNPAKLGLARFMSEIVNAQDKAGDTALNIAAKIGNRSIISQLIEVCADPNLANRQGLRPLDFGIGIDSAKEGVNGENAEEGEANGLPGSSQKSRDSNDDIVTSITHLLTDTASSFQTDMRAKQHSIDALHASLRTTSAQLADARKSLEALQDKSRSETLARQTAVNLGRALQDEQYRLAHLKEKHGEVNMGGAVQWESEIDAIANGARPAELPKAALLRARIEAIGAQTEATRRSEASLRGQSREVELKFRHLVALAAKCGDADVDTHLESLMRAVESEKGELEIGRVRRFLGGVDGLAH